ncbi:MAG TPA: TetR/AcrR family transcriptional regulator [Steroidobacteraceae bacterium]|nr:TetR/AcrR family transcriptional regulator [Steroidobacteraceae bacterium]
MSEVATDYISERRLEEKDRRRSQILDAAESVAATSGIESLTMEQVARRARLSRALIYLYFKDKLDLHFGLCERGIALLTQRFEEAHRRPMQGLAKIIAIGRAYVAFSQEFPVYFDALARFQAQEAELPQSPGATAAGSLTACLAASARLHEIIASVIAEGQRDGTISPAAGDPLAVSLTLWGFMHGIIQLSTTKAALLGELGLDTRALQEQALKLATRALAPA